MKPIEFAEQTHIIAKDQKEYLTLPALIKNNDEAEVVSCWKLSFQERIILLFTGKIWLSLWMFRTEGRVNAITPSRLTINKAEVID